MDAIDGRADGADYKGKRELIFVVEASKALQPHWPRIKNHYVAEIISKFFEPKRTTWMYSDVAAHGNYARQNSAIYQKHCLLIAFNSPSNYPTAIPKLPAQNSEQNYWSETSTELKPFYNVGDVAKSFAQSFISLSIISPTRCSMFENIFNTAKRDVRVTETDFENVDNPDKFLILLSKNYPEVHMALNRRGMHCLSMHQVFMTDKTSQPLKKNLSMRKTHSGNRSVIRTRKVYGSIPLPVVKVEPFDVPRPLLFHLPAYSAYINGQPSSTSQSPTFGNDLNQEIKPLISRTQMNNGFSQFSLRLSPYVLPSTLQQTGFFKAWEGYLSGEFLDLQVHIRFEVYRSAGASETLANDWPSTMQILCHVDRSTLEKCVYASAFIKQCIGKGEVLCFRKLNQPKLKYNSLSPTEWLLVRLPSQILLLCLPKVDDWCGGLLLSLHMEYLLYELVTSQRIHKQQGVQPRKRAKKIA